MTDYLVQVRDAVSALLASMWQEHLALDTLREDNAPQAQVEARELTVAILASATLQLAEHGLNVVHGDKPLPSGRALGRENLSSVIREARDQALQWESGRLRKRGREVFGELDEEYGPQFGAFEKRSLAFDIVELLEWRHFADFERDMLSLG